MTIYTRYYAPHHPEHQALPAPSGQPSEYPNLQNDTGDQRAPGDGRQNAFRPWIEARIGEYMKLGAQFYAVTLTCKQVLPLPGGGVEKLTHGKVSKAIGVFLKHLNTDLYGKAYRRHGRKLLVVPAIEEGRSGRLHAHLLLERRPHSKFTDQEFVAHAARLWRSLQWSHREVKIEPITGLWGAERFASYILKEVRRNHEALDLWNLNI